MLKIRKVVNEHITALMIPNRKFYHDCLFFYFLFLVFSLTTSVLWSLCEQLNLICIVFKRELMCQFPVNQVLRVNNRVLHRDSNPELVYSQKRQTAYQQGSQRQVIPYCFLALLNTSDVKISNYSFSPINCILQICEKVFKTCSQLYGVQEFSCQFWYSYVF